MKPCSFFLTFIIACVIISAVMEQVNESIYSEAFTNAINSAVEHLRPINNEIKSKMKDAYHLFYDIMVRTHPDIEKILAKKTGARNPGEDAKLAAFKKDMSFIYRQINGLLFENTEGENFDTVQEKKETKISKMVSKIAKIIPLMDYIGHNEIQEEFMKYGIQIKFTPLQEQGDAYQNPNIKQAIVDVFKDSQAVLKEKEDKMNDIKNSVFTTEVPPDLQYDSDINRSGLKVNDFIKLAKMAIRYRDDKDIDKIEQATTNEVENNTFDINRLETIRAIILDISSEAQKELSKPTCIVEDNTL